MMWLLIVLSLLGICVYLYMIGFRITRGHDTTVKQLMDSLEASEQGVYEIEDSYQQMILSLEEHLNARGINIQTLNEELAELRLENEGLRDDVASKSRALQLATREITMADNRIALLELSVEEMKAENEGLKERIENLIVENREAGLALLDHDKNCLPQAPRKLVMGETHE